MIYSSPVVIGIRNLTRKIGMNTLISRILSGSDYEDKFGPIFISKIQSGDCVWDVGANVGLYTTRFAQQIGGVGNVIAFEPVPSCFKVLAENTKNINNIFPINVAMGSSDGEITMHLDDKELAATHKVVTKTETYIGKNTCIVSVRSPVSLINEYPEWFPNVIKIDVEGYEGAVFDGLKDILSDSRLRCIGAEIHFGLLEERNEKNRPKQIEMLLKKNGFHVEWTDHSHIIATH